MNENYQQQQNQWSPPQQQQPQSQQWGQQPTPPQQWGPPPQQIQPQLQQWAHSQQHYNSEGFKFKNEWSHGICGCCNSCKICACVFFCGPCYNCYIHDKVNECCCTPVFCPCSMVNVRTKIRTHYKIDGAIWKDVCCIAFCGACVLCQMANELKTQGIIV